MNEMLPSKIKTSKTIFQVLGWIELIGTIIGGLAMIIAGAMSREQGITSIILGIVFIILGIVIGILYLKTAQGIADKKNWAKTVGIILAILMLFSFPIGTALGIIILIDLFSDEGKQWFAEGESNPSA